MRVYPVRCMVRDQATMTQGFLVATAGLSVEWKLLSFCLLYKQLGLALYRGALHNTSISARAIC